MPAQSRIWSTPPDAPRVVSTTSRPCRSASMARSVYGRNALPISVRRTPRPMRWNSGTPSSTSSACTLALSDGCERYSASAARRKLPRSAAARNASSCANSMSPTSGADRPKPLVRSRPPRGSAIGNFYHRYRKGCSCIISHGGYTGTEAENSQLFSNHGKATGIRRQDMNNGHRDFDQQVRELEDSWANDPALEGREA